MPENTNNLGLALVQAGQDQKHVTVNESLRLLDVTCQLSVRDRDLSTPPASPTEGDRYIVGDGATDDWATWDRNVAAYLDGAWTKITPRLGWQAFVEDELVLTFWTGSSWTALTAVTDLEAQVVTPNGATTGLAVREELVTLSGASTSTVVVFPDRSIVQAVSVRVVDPVTGATSFDVGFAGEQSKFGGSIGLGTGSTNVGVIGPTAVYSDTAVVLTANDSDFTGGTVRVALHYVTASAPTS